VASEAILFMGLGENLATVYRWSKRVINLAAGVLVLTGSSHICHCVASVSGVKLACLPGTHHAGWCQAAPPTHHFPVPLPDESSSKINVLL